MGCGGSKVNPDRAHKKQSIMEYQQKIGDTHHSQQHTHNQNLSQKYSQIYHQDSNQKIDMSQKEREVLNAQLPSPKKSREFDLQGNSIFKNNIQLKLAHLVIDKNNVLMNESQQKEMLNAIKILEDMNYKVEQIIGYGFFGPVVSITKKDQNCQRMAVKLLFYNMEGENVLDKNQMSEQDYLNMKRSKEVFFKKQLDIIKQISSPNLIKLIDFKDQGDIFFIFIEPCYSNLYQFLQKNKDTPIQEQSNFVAWNQLILCLEMLHDKDIVLGDLQDDNILIDNEGILKFSEFGIGKSIQNQEIVSMYEQSKSRGNILFQPPEILKKALQNSGNEDHLNDSQTSKIAFDKSRDVWSLGMIFYLMAGGSRKFLSEYGLSNNQYQKAPNVNDETNQFISSILSLDQKNRPSIIQIRKHFNSLIQEFIKNEDSCLNVDQILQNQIINPNNLDYTSKFPNPFKILEQDYNNQQKISSSDQIYNCNMTQSDQKMLSQVTQSNNNKEINNLSKSLNLQNQNNLQKQYSKECSHLQENILLNNQICNHNKELKNLIAHKDQCVMENNQINNMPIERNNQFERNNNQSNRNKFTTIIENEFDDKKQDLDEHNNYQNIDQELKNSQIQQSKFNVSNINKLDVHGILNTSQNQKKFTKEDPEKHFLLCIEKNPNDKVSHNQLGVLYMDEFKDFDKAKIHLEKALQLDPNYPEALINYGNLNKNHLKNFEESERYYQKALQIDPQNAEAAYNLGQLYQFDLQKNQMAEKYYKIATEIDPKHQQSLSNLEALKQSGLRNSRRSVNHQQMDLLPDNNDFSTYYNLGIEYLKENKIHDAEQGFKKAIELQPDDYHSLLQLGILYKDYDHQPQLSEKYLKKAHFADKQQALPLFHLGQLSLSEFKDFQQAETYFKSYLEKQPDDYEAYENLALVYDNEKTCQPEQAEKYYLKCIELNKDELSPYINLANLYQNKLNNQEKSIEYYKLGLDIQPENNIRCHEGLAQAYEAQKDYKQTEYHYQEVLKQDPDNYKANSNIALLYKNNFKDYDKSEKLYFKSLQLKDEYNTNFQLAQLYEYNLYRHADAQQYYLRAIQIDPSQFMPYFRIAQINFYDIKDYEKAAEFYKKAIELNPNDYDSNYKLGIIYQNELQQPLEAEKYFKQASIIDPSQVDPLFYLGLISEKNHQDYKQAVYYFFQVVDLNPNHKNAYNQLANLYQFIFKDEKIAQQFRKKAQQVKS